MRLKPSHWVLLSLTGLIIVLLFLAPTRPPMAGQKTAKEVLGEPPSVENDIDSALAIIQSEAPMQGILLLKAIADKHPGNFRAQYHLGRFSAQTGQWQKVIQRFEVIQKIDPGFSESDYWLGLAKFNLGENEFAKSHFSQFVKSEQNNIQLLREAETMLNQIK